MSQNRMNMLLHPIRLRIVSQFANGNLLTTSELATYLPDVPQATLYRQLNTLLKAGIIHIHEQRQVRGTLEKVYQLVRGGESISSEELLAMDPVQQLTLFSTFTSQLIHDYASYIKQDQIEPMHDGLSIRQAPIWMNEAELSEFTHSLRELISQAIQRPPTPDRRLRTLTTILIPQALSKIGLPSKGESDE